MSALIYFTPDSDFFPILSVIVVCQISIFFKEVFFSKVISIIYKLPLPFKIQ